MPTPELTAADTAPRTTAGRVDPDRYPHLKSEAATHVGAPLAERKHFIRAGRWIGYTRAVAALARLEELLDHPRTHRMPNLLIVGDTNNGKTAIVRRFQALHPANDAPDEDGVLIPALLVQAPPQPDETEFYDAILGALAAPYRPNDRAARKRAAVVTLLRRTRVRILIVDEIHHVLAGAAIKQRQFLNMLKYLGNEVQIPIVDSGSKTRSTRCSRIRSSPIASSQSPSPAGRSTPTICGSWRASSGYFRWRTRPTSSTRSSPTTSWRSPRARSARSWSCCSVGPLRR